MAKAKGNIVCGCCGKDYHGSPLRLKSRWARFFIAEYYPTGHSRAEYILCGDCKEPPLAFFEKVESTKR